MLSVPRPHVSKARAAEDLSVRKKFPVPVTGRMRGSLGIPVVAGFAGLRRAAFGLRIRANSLCLPVFRGGPRQAKTTRRRANGHGAGKKRSVAGKIARSEIGLSVSGFGEGAVMSGLFPGLQGPGGYPESAWRCGRSSDNLSPRFAGPRPGPDPFSGLPRLTAPQSASITERFLSRVK